NQCSVYAMDLKYDASIEALTVVKYIVIKSANIILNNLRNPTNGISIKATNLRVTVKSKGVSIT
ncbi:17461_t:CDS:2, partial [Entrophospora sp. SA101]